MLTVGAKGVLATDSDADGGQLTAILVSKPRKGSLTLHADGSLVFRPAHNFVGSMSFKYEATDGVNYSLASVVPMAAGPLFKRRLSEQQPCRVILVKADAMPLHTVLLFFGGWPGYATAGRTTKCRIDC